MFILLLEAFILFGPFGQVLSGLPDLAATILAGAPANRKKYVK